MLSKKAIDMLEYNGYFLKQDGSRIVFKNSGIDRIGLMIVIILSAIGIVLLTAIVWWAGLIALIIAFLIFKPLVERIPGESKLIIDTANKSFELNNHSGWYSFNRVKGVFVHSKFVDEYSSAFKSTSEEHQVTIGLELDEQQLPLFKLISDHAKPSKEMKEVVDFLESCFRP
ncbi:hypothetical protein [Ekhidna sp.]|uniref:hypothetical protein n=1 Tax=Ekhidna sp. TaxID=2608089 RepID=UPI003B58C15F